MKRMKKKMRRHQERKKRVAKPKIFTNTAMIPGAIVFDLRSNVGVLGESFEIILVDRKNGCVLDKDEFHKDIIKSQEDLQGKLGYFRQSLSDNGVF